MKAVFFGSIGSVVETSELQRKSFNDAFAEAGLNWYWDQKSYRQMLTTSGGQKRISDFAAMRNETVDASALHARKSVFFQAALEHDELPLRPGVAATVALAKDASFSLGFVTSTERETVEIIAQSVTKATSTPFDVVTWRSDERPGKPEPAVYNKALAQLRLTADDVIAIEDNRDGVLSSKAAGLFTIGFPGENTSQEDMSDVDQLVIDGLADSLAKLIEAESAVTP